MRFDILTLFPEAFTAFMTTSIIGRAVESGLIEIICHDIRDFSTNKHHKVDDVPYGGGAGMVMMPQPLFDSLEAVKALKKDKAPVIFFTPSEQILNQEMIELFSQGVMPSAFSNNQKKEGIDRYILLCGHYEGIDQRVRDQLVDIELSVGNFILTGGELPAQIFIDSVARLIPGVIGKIESHLVESFSAEYGRNTIEHPHYTRPADFRGHKVPDILLSGHHANIEQWRVDENQILDQFVTEKMHKGPSS